MSLGQLLAWMILDGGAALRIRLKHGMLCAWLISSGLLAMVPDG